VHAWLGQMQVLFFEVFSQSMAGDSCAYTSKGRGDLASSFSSSSSTTERNNGGRGIRCRQRLTFENIHFFAILTPTSYRTFHISSTSTQSRRRLDAPQVPVGVQPVKDQSLPLPCLTTAQCRNSKRSSRNAGRGMPGRTTTDETDLYQGSRPYGERVMVRTYPSALVRPLNTPERDTNGGKAGCPRTKVAGSHCGCAMEGYQETPARMLRWWCANESQLEKLPAYIVPLVARRPVAAKNGCSGTSPGILVIEERRWRRSGDAGMHVYAEV